ncbi:uncharacterized protein LOC129911921 isoform X2 [Episyrphus balteatus]|uniref:uncharacterized protein LOC129911921 isoform X2 n=1 Tax=Episyrphus balteatus TaxID=286459 RepID=UPI002485F842|nr:uncharacterized protein LOC129911921 isoform X2 [Episyrphus balteatus]
MQNNNLTKKPRSKIAIREIMADGGLLPSASLSATLPASSVQTSSSSLPTKVVWPRIESRPLTVDASSSSQQVVMPVVPVTTTSIGTAAAAAAAAVPMDLLADIFLRLNTSLMSSNRLFSANEIFPHTGGGASYDDGGKNEHDHQVVRTLLPVQHNYSKSYFSAKTEGRKRTLTPMASNEECEDEIKMDTAVLAPPPKKKWIRHYLREEPYSNGHSSPSSFIMIKTPTPSTTITTNKHQQQQQLHQQQGLQQQSQEQQSFSNNNLNCSPKTEMLTSLFSNNNNNNTTITVVDKNKNPIFTTTTNHGNNSKISNTSTLPATTFLNGGVNLAALSAAAAAATTQPIVINVSNTRTAANTFSANNNNVIIPHTTIPIPTTTTNYNTNSNLRNSPPMGVASAVAAGGTASPNSSCSVFRKKCIPLTPPPMSNRKFIESSRIRSYSLSSNKITANSLVGSNGFVTTNNTNNSSSNNINNNTSNINNNTPAILHNHHIHQVLAAAAEDSSQSSLNLSSSGYLSGGSINSNVGSINLSSTSTTTSTGGVPMNGVSMMNGSPPRGGSLLVSGGHLEHQSSSSSMSCVASSAPTSSGVHQLHGGSIGGGSRRRTISSNSNGAGTREVHNKLEKHRRAQLKECFEQLKSQLQLKDEERKKTSNLSILGAALKHVMALKIKEQELEQQVELLAKEKINAQKKIVNLKRELGPKVENIDFSSIISDIELGSIPIERVTEGLNDSISLSSGRGSMLYSSSSSLSSGSGGNTMSSPLGAGMQTSMPTALSPVISQSTTTTSSFSASSSSNNSSPISPIILMKSSSPLSQSTSATSSSLVVTNISTINNANGGCSSSATSVTMPLSLTAKNISATSMTRGSPTPSTPSPSPSSSSGVSSSSSIHSSSPPIGGVKIVPNIPTTSCVKFGTVTNVSANGNTFVSSPVINITHSENNGGISSSSSNSVYNATASGMPLNMNVAVVSSSSATTFPSFFSSSSLPSAATITTSVSHGKESNGRNGLTRKTPSSSDGHNNNIDSYFNNNQHHYQHQQQQQQLLDEGEQPAKVFKVFNGLALGQMDKDNKLGLAATPLQLSQVVGGGSLVVSPFLSSSQNGGSLRLVGANSLATIELSSGPSSNQSRCSGSLLGQSLSPPNSGGGAQLHKLLMSAVSAGGGATNTISNGNTSTYVSAGEVGRLPGGAELNILPTATNATASLYRGNGKLSIMNNGISIKGAVNDTNSTRGGVHVLNTQVLQSANGLSSIGVSQAQQNNNFAQLIATTPQMAGKINLSVGGGQSSSLPLIGTQYLGSMKPMVVAVSNNNTNNNSNSNQPTLSSLSSVVVPPTSLTTSTAIVTGTTNGNAL